MVYQSESFFTLQERTCREPTGSLTSSVTTAATLHSNKAVTCCNSALELREQRGLRLFCEGYRKSKRRLGSGGAGSTEPSAPPRPRTDQRCLNKSYLKLNVKGHLQSLMI